MTFSSTAADTNHIAQGTGTDQDAASAGASPPPNHNALSYNNSALGLLHDDRSGNHPVESKDITILRRLKLAILEGQHPYFKANVDLSNLQDLVLGSGSRSIGAGVHPHVSLDSSSVQPSGHIRRHIPPALDDLGPSEPTTLDYGNEDSRSTEVSPEKSLRPGMTSARLEDVNMVNIDSFERSEQSSGNSLDDPSQNSDSDNRRPSTQTLGRYVLHSPIPTEPDSQLTHKRKLSDTPTLVDSDDRNTESEVHIKRESPPYQLSGSQPQALDPSSSSMASFASNSTVSTGLTSEDGGAVENAVDVETDLAGYNPKYGNKADYLRRQKVRSKAIESIDEKNRRAGQRQDEKPSQKSPVRPMDYGTRRGSGPNSSPTRGRNPPSRTHTSASISSPNGHVNNSRRTPPLDTLPPPNFQTSPHGRPNASFRPISPAPEKYSIPRRPRDPSPTRDYRSQYDPFNDPRSARPRPIVSSPPRGSPPRESPAPRAAIDRQSIDSYSNPYPRNETRSFDLRPSSPIYGEGSRTAGSYSIDGESNWSARGLTRAPPPPPPSRNTPSRDLIRERTPFGSTTLPTNPNAGYRPQGLPDAPNNRYSPYDAPPRRTDWASRDWDPTNRSSDSKPKLQDRFNIDSSWSRDSLESRSLDDYGPRPIRDEFAHPDDYASRFRREPSPASSRYSDGFRSGFSRPPEVEGIRPMKRSRPDDGYTPRSGPSLGNQYDFDNRAGTHYLRQFSRGDEYEPRPRPPY
ncbi:unnamed protein product [Rhizoctonia solani]|uniref:Uncharacterized protein n=1 Tax=Rhizoctonia solani TaxID=456999 RepID=A0A8H3BYL6_9AGAM|nr:unnamed protein product [Rhizoctonia solani]